MVEFKQYDRVELNDGRVMVMIEPSEHEGFYIGEVRDEDENVLDWPTVPIKDVKRVIK